MDRGGGISRTAIVFLIAGILSVSCDRKSPDTPEDVTVFLAACFAPLIDAVRGRVEREAGLRIRSEISGSQVVCRKVTELGRDCDLMMVADHRLFKIMASSHVSWRIDFARDEVVLGVGSRAKRVDEAETDWVDVLLVGDIHLGRVDENLGPIGYRTLLVWKLKEAMGHPGLMGRLKAKSGKILDHVMHLAALLKAGDLDYGFLYRSTCVEHDIRFIPLDKGINLGSTGMDYASAQVGIRTHESAGEPISTISGSPIIYSLTVPVSAAHPRQGTALIRALLEKNPAESADFGYQFFGPRFYGSKADYAPFRDLAAYAGEF